jgi:glycogen debranching enzyme
MESMPVVLVRPDILYAWKGPSLLITSMRGECNDRLGLTGYYFREARFLQTLRLTVNGEPPWLCEAATVRPDLLTFNFVHPEITNPGGGGTGQSGDEEVLDAKGIPERSLDISLSYHVEIAALQVVLTIANRARREIDVEVAWDLAADYADIQEAQSGRREQEAPVATTSHDREIEFTYGHPTLTYRTSVHHNGRWHFANGRAVTRLTLPSRHTESIALRIVPHPTSDEISEGSAIGRAAVHERWRQALTRVEAPGNRVFERVLARNVGDVASFPLLDGRHDEWLAMQAGMPLYPAFFGRDGLTAGWQAGYLDRGEMLEAALVKLARLQSDRIDDWRDEQPGRIPYQIRTGPLAILNLNPYSAYYADFASPLMFVISLANLWAWTGDRRRVEQHWDTARRILDWAREYGDMDGDGYLEYQTRSSKGTKNQGWKDSGDAIIYDDGSPVPAPIATCELQGYWYVAQELMALLALVMGNRDDAMAHRKSAGALKERFNRDWWIEDERFVALALDPDKRQVRALTSNVGHCLACGVIDRERLPALVDRMFEPDLFSGWGIRTLSTKHAFYNPISYHRGTVWGVEQATSIFGLRRFGFDTQALKLTQAMFELAQLYPEDRIPECVGGYAREDRAVPGAYPRANTPQLWNATAFPLSVQTMLGLVPLGALNTLLVDPALPAWMPELIVHGLRVGDATVTLRFWRSKDGSSRWKVLEKHGTLRVVRQPAPESLSASWIDRIEGLLGSL